MSPLMTRVPIISRWNFTFGEALIALASAAVFISIVWIHGALPFQDHYEPVFYERTGQHQSGHLTSFTLALTYATAAHNSIFTLFLGLPFDRALWWHK
jgi:hypothetical protein